MSKTKLPISEGKAMSTAMNGSTFSVSPISWTFRSLHLAISAQPSQTMVKNLKKQQPKTRRRRTNGCEIATSPKFGIADCWSFSDSAVFECILELGETQSKEFYICISSAWINLRVEIQMKIQFSSVVIRCESEIQCREACERIDKEPLWYLIVSPKFENKHKQRSTFFGSLLERTTKSWPSSLSWWSVQHLCPGRGRLWYMLD